MGCAASTPEAALNIEKTTAVTNLIGSGGLLAKTFLAWTRFTRIAKFERLEVWLIVCSLHAAFAVRFPVVHCGVCVPAARRHQCKGQSEDAATACQGKGCFQVAVQGVPWRRHAHKGRCEFLHSRGASRGRQRRSGGDQCETQGRSRSQGGQGRSSASKEALGRCQSGYVCRHVGGPQVPCDL